MKLLGLLGAILVLSPISRFLYHQQAIRTHITGLGYGFVTWNHLDGLALGAIVAILVRTHGWNRQRMLRLSILLLSSAILLMAFGYPFGILTRSNGIGEALQYLPWNLAFASLLGVLLLVGSGPRKLITAPPFMIFLGKISYGLYLYHLMVFFGYDWIAKQIDFSSRFNLSLWEQGVVEDADREHSGY